MMNKQGFTKLVFYDPQSKGLVQKCGNKCHIIISLIIENFIEKYGNDGQGRVYQNCKYNDLRDKGSCAAEWPYRDFFFSSSLPTLGQNKTNYAYSNNDQGKVYQNWNFHDSRGSGSYIIKA